MDSLRADFESGGEYSDMTLACGQQTWKVHSIVICPQSKRIAEEYRKLKTAKAEIRIRVEERFLELVADVIQYCYSAKYPLAAYSSKMSAVAHHASLWSFLQGYGMPELKKMSRKRFEETARPEIGSDEFVQCIQDVFHTKHPSVHAPYLGIIAEHSAEIFGSSQKYHQLRNALKADNVFLYKVTVGMAMVLEKRAQTRPEKREHYEEETDRTNKRQKLVGSDTARGAEDVPVASKKSLDQVITLRPQDVQCCAADLLEHNARETPSSEQTSGAQDLLKANGFVTFRCPDCRDSFDAKIKLKDKYIHDCRNRFKGKGTEHTGAVWHAFFRDGVAMSLSAERQFWRSLERLQKTLEDDKLK